MYVFQCLLFFTISTTRVLLASSNATYLPSGVIRPKLVVVVLIGHSVTSRVVSVLDVAFSVVVLVCEVWHPASTSVPLIVVLVVVSVVWVCCAHRYPANSGIAAKAASFFIVPPNRG